MMTLIDLFREFSHVATVENYPKSARLLYYTMLWYWNEQKRPDIARLPHAQLYTLAGLPEATYRIAFKYLADEGWIKRVKSRNRAISAWIMRDRCAKSAPPAGFRMSPAQSKSEKRLEESPHNGDSSTPILRGTEDAHDVRKCTSTDNARDNEATRDRPPEVSAESGRNEKIPDRDFEAQIPNLER